MAAERIDEIYDLDALKIQQDKVIAMLGETKKAIIDLNTSRGNSKQADLSGFADATKELDKAIDQSNDTIKKTTKAHNDLTGAVGAGIKVTASMNEAAKAVISLINQRFSAEAKLVTVETDYAVATAKTKVELQKLGAEQKAQAQADLAQVGSRERAVAQIKVLTLEKDKLNLINAEEKKQYDEIVIKIERYNKFLKESGTIAEKQKANIGNYSGAINILKSSLAEVSAKIEANTKAGKANSDQQKNLEKEYAILNKLVNSQAAGFATVAQELRANQKALMDMSKAGLEGTEAFNKLAQSTGKLKDDIADLRQRTKVLGSDTFVFDGLIQGAQSLAGVYGAVKGSMTLLGIESEEFEKTLNKLMAVQTVIQSLQQIGNAIQKESAFMLLIQSARTKVLIAVEAIRQYILTGTTKGLAQNTAAMAANTAGTEATAVATTGATTAMKLLRIALITTGIGALLVLLPMIANGMGLFGDSTEEATDSLDKLNASIDRNNESLKFTNENLDEQGAKLLFTMKMNGATQKELNDQEVKNIREKEANVAISYFKQKQNLEDFVKTTQHLREAFKEQDIEGVDILDARNEQAKVMMEDMKKNGEEANNLRKAGDAKERENILSDLAEKKKSKEKGAKDESGLLKEYIKKNQEQTAIASRQELELARDVYSQILGDQENSEIDRLESLRGFHMASSKLIALDEKAKLDASNLQIQTDLAKASEIKNLTLREKTKNEIIKVSEETQTNIKSTAQREQQAADTDFSKTTIKIVHEGFIREEQELADHVEKLKFIHESKLAQLNSTVNIAENTQQNAAINRSEEDIIKAHGAKKIKLEKQLQDDITKINELASLKRLQIELDELERTEAILKNSAIINPAMVKDIEEAITANVLTQTEIRTNARKREAQDAEDIRNAELDKIATFAAAGMDLVGTFGDASFQKKKDRLTAEQNLNDQKNAKDIELVNASTRTEQEKAAAIAIIQARAAQQKIALDLRNRKLDYEKAKFDKEIAILQVIAQIAIDIAKADFFSAALAGIALIKLIATPIPHYEHGRGTGKEEFAVVGEGGQHEYIHRAGGLIEKTPAVETVTYLMPGDKVFPNKESIVKELTENTNIENINNTPVVQVTDGNIINNTVINNETVPVIEGVTNLGNTSITNNITSKEQHETSEDAKIHVKNNVLPGTVIKESDNNISVEKNVENNLEKNVEKSSKVSDAYKYLTHKLLQPLVRFFTGTKYVELGINKKGIDTIPAMIHEGEAIIPANINKEYKPAIEAIYDKKISAGIFNEFISNVTDTDMVMPKVSDTKSVEKNIILKENLTENNVEKIVTGNLLPGVNNLIEKTEKTEKNIINNIIENNNSEKIITPGRHGIKEKDTEKTEKSNKIEIISHLIPKGRDYPKQQLIRELIISTLPMSNYSVNNHGSISKSDMENFTSEIVSAVNDIKIHTTEITKDGWREHNKRLSDYDTWVNKYIKN